MKYAVELKNVNKVFTKLTEDAWVLKKVDLVIKPGSFTVIFGPSGCGKSTMLNITLGLEKPTTGEVSILGESINTMTQDEISEFRKRNIGIIYQQSNWIKSLDVISNVAFPLLLNGVKRSVALAKAGNALRKVGMDKWSVYMPTELSIGQQQKVALARALITDPQIIFADEPTGNLDYRSGVELVSIFDRLVDEGKTVIMVTHNIENFGQADNVVQMLDGKIINIFTSKDDSALMKKALIDGLQPPAEHEEDLSKMPLPHHESKKRSSLATWFKSFIGSLASVFIYFALIPIHLFYVTYYKFANLKWTPAIFSKFAAFLNNIYETTISFFEGKRRTIRYIDIIDLSLKNLFYKKSRALVTIGGIALGIGFIVLLVSVGYGLEDLVVNRVARLNELRQADVVPAVSSSLSFDDESLSQLKNLAHVEQALPLINAAANVEYNNSIRDVVIYGVQEDYLDAVNLNLLQGRIFQDNTLEVKNLGQPIIPETDLATTDSNQTGRVIQLPKSDNREIVVNSSFVGLLGIDNKTAIDKEVVLTYVITGDLLDKENGLSSYPEKYKIVGVISNEDAPIAYVPIKDLKSLGVSKYSQVKVVVDNESSLASVRQSIHAMGYTTTSIVDTVDQIGRVFSSVRVAFGVAGLVALIVAILGMFNTLTVSLLERTREVGLMKALGMKSEEVSELLLSESMTIAVIGGLGGLLIGYIGGNVISALMSLWAISSNQGYLDISSIPFGLVVGILGVSVVVGWVTGYFPTRRATTISALDALRYE